VERIAHRACLLTKPMLIGPAPRKRQARRR
jgi:hypothetical protein